MVWYGNKLRENTRALMAMLEMLYINTMLKVKQNNRVMKVANMVDFVRRKQKQKVISLLKSLF